MQAYNFGYSTSVAGITIGMDTSGNIAIGTQRSLYSYGYFDCVAIDYDSKTQKCGMVTDVGRYGFHDWGLC